MKNQQFFDLIRPAFLDFFGQKVNQWLEI